MTCPQLRFRLMLQCMFYRQLLFQWSLKHISCQQIVIETYDVSTAHFLLSLKRMTCRQLFVRLLSTTYVFDGRANVPPANLTLPIVI